MMKRFDKIIDMIEKHFDRFFVYFIYIFLFFILLKLSGIL